LIEQKSAHDTSEAGSMVLRDGDCAGERDEGEAFGLAMKDLMRLDRYERRAASRMRRAINAFICLQHERYNLPGCDAR
jgi:hypothetical protein